MIFLVFLVHCKTLFEKDANLIENDGLKGLTYYG